MSPRPTHAYLTLKPDGRFELVVSDIKLNPCGERLLRGDSFPLSVHRLYNPNTTQTMDMLKEAVTECNAFLKGEIVTGGSLTFGEKQTTTRRKR